MFPGRFLFGCESFPVQATEDGGGQSPYFSLLGGARWEISCLISGQTCQKDYAGAALHFWLSSAPAWVERQEQISSASWTLPPLMTLILLAKGIPKAAFRARLASLLHGTCPEHSQRVPWRGMQAVHTSSAPTLRVLAKMRGATRPRAQH